MKNTMKIIGKIIRIIITVIFAVVTVVVGSFTAVFFVSKDEPQDIFLFDYALIYEVDEDKKLDMWVVKKINDFDMSNGDGIVYYNGAYKSANVLMGRDGRFMYFNADNLEESVEIKDGEIVGKIVALWRQK